MVHRVTAWLAKMARCAGTTLWVLASALSAGAAWSQSARVLSVSPQGEVALVRQVVVRFEAPVVPAGEPGLAAPFALQCNGKSPAGSGRWLDEKRWAFDFNDALPAGQRCSLKFAPNAPTSLTSLAGPQEYRFSTGGPAVISVQPDEGEQIEEDQHFLLHLTGAADETSVTRAAWCEAEGVGERLAVRVVGGAERQAVLRERARRMDPTRLLLLACQRPFAAQAKVRLVWGPGVASAAVAGQAPVATRQTQRWLWNVRERFTAQMSCERENAAAACLPLRPLTLRFSRPVPRALALAARLQVLGPVSGAAAGAAPTAPAGAAAAALQPRAAEGSESAGSLDEVQFPAPLPENARLQLSLPPAVVDDSGRALSNAARFPLTVTTGGLPPLAKFNGNGFGIVEAPQQATEPALLPLTLRHVQADLQGASTAGQVAIKTLAPTQTDTQLLQWLSRLQRWHERELSAKEAGLPRSQWTETVTETDDKGRPRNVQRERSINTRELSLLARESEVRRADLPQLKGSAPRATEVLGLPLPGRGLHVVEVSSRLLGQSLLAKPEPMYVRTGVLVTNLAVHFKKGRSSSLVWVTTLDRARPVAGAKVVVNDCAGTALWSGSTDAQGMARIERGFDDEARGGVKQQPERGAECLTPDGLFVTARAADDLGFVFSGWSRGIETWRFNIDTARGLPLERRAHTVFDRTLLRVGDTVSMKHFVREETERGLSLPAVASLPDSLLITHLGSGSEVSLPLTWPRGARSAQSQWAIPKTATLGLYEVVLKRGDTQLSAGRIRVEAFRVPLTDARLAGPKGVQVAPSELAFDAQINAMAGGPMPGLPLKLTALLSEREAQFAGYEDFRFMPSSKGSENAARRDEDEESSSSSARVVAQGLAATTDAQGAARLTVPKLPALRGPAELQAEMSFTDANGETQTVSQRLALWPSAVVVGLRAPEWAIHKGAARFTVLVLDTSGKPLAGRAVQVAGRVHQTLSTRKRIVGGFYAYDNQHQVQELGSLCSGSTDAQGRLECDSPTRAVGEVELVASAKDDAGRTATASSTVWIGSEERWWFAQGNDDRIDLLPEKREVEPGQIARIQVRMPFAHATALVTVEREGVIDSRVVQLTGRQPVIELPIPGTASDRSWAPNVTVGVLVLRGRLREAPWWSLLTWGWREPGDWWRAFRYEGRDWRAPTAMVDLAKPSYKFGATQLLIGHAAHRLDVKVSTPQQQYKVRDKVATTVRVTGPGGKPVAHAEVAFAAVDEGLLALADNTSWDLLGHLLRPRPWGVETATAASEVIGRRHYGRKALPPGGGGGRNPTRELFDTLLLWRGSVALDANGEARIEVPLNDSLTSFRLVAIADDGGERFGQGHTVVRVSQDLQMLPGLALLVREGDRIETGFTLRNTTNRVMQVKASLTGIVSGSVGNTTTNPAPASGAAGSRSAGTTPAMVQAPQTVQVAAGAATEVRWTVEVPPGATRIEWQGEAAEQGGPSGAAGAGSAAARDSVKISQVVISPVPVRVWQASLQPLSAQAAAGLSLPVAPPEGHLPGRGGVQVVLQPRLSGALPGLKRFFEQYPYSCLEQKTSRALALGDGPGWKDLGEEVGSYLDSDGLANYFPAAAGSAARGSDRLTAYLLSAAHEAGVVWPTPQRDAMLAGLTAFVQGRVERRFPSPRADLDVRKLAALDALARHGRAEARMLSSIAFTPAVWPTSALLDAWSVLQRLAQAPEREARLAQIQSLLRARLVEGGTTLKFSTEAQDDWWWLMESADGNAARLLLAALQSPAWKDDIPRLVNGALARQKGGAWRTTTANLWGVLALEKFGKAFESEAVNGITTLTLGPQNQNQDWATTPQGQTLALAWPSGAATFNARHEGAGRPWLTVQTLAAVPLQAPLFAGYRISRSVSAVQRQRPDTWSRGDVLRVRLEIDASADMAWVVVNDPVPAGATLLGSGLGRDSQIATQGERREGSAQLAYEERAADAWRSYFAWMPRGKHVVEYSLRLNSAGRFGLPPTRVEAMYAPESFAEWPNAALEVKP